MQPPELSAYRHIVFLTGGDLAAASGLALPAVAEVGRTAGDPLALWALYAPQRRETLAAVPNTAHIALATLPDRLASEQSLVVITFNPDGLHQRAGSRNVIELHGSLLESRCSAPGCPLPPFFDPHDHERHLPYCPFCGQPLRPAVLLPGESPPPAVAWPARRAVRTSELFVVAGLLDEDPPVADYLALAQAAGATILWVGNQPQPATVGAVEQAWPGRAQKLLPLLLA